jgi:hypothetical protein
MELDSEVDIQGTFQNKFEQVDDPQFERLRELDHHDLDGVGNYVTMEIIYEQVQMAFQTIIIIQSEVSNECNSSIDEDEPPGTHGQPLGDGKNVDEARMHLVLHLVEELDIYGPVATMCMYPVEQYMKTLKKYVGNMA